MYKINDTDKIIDIVCKHVGIERSVADSLSRKASAVLARQLAWTVCYKKLQREGMTYEKLGQLFSAKHDHSNIGIAIKKIENNMHNDRVLKAMYENIMQEVNVRVFEFASEDVYLKSLIKRRSDAIKLVDDLEDLINEYEKYN